VVDNADKVTFDKEKSSNSHKYNSCNLIDCKSKRKLEELKKKIREIGWFGDGKKLVKRFEIKIDKKRLSKDLGENIIISSRKPKTQQLE
jgi:hypothetical protein